MPYSLMVAPKACWTTYRCSSSRSLLAPRATSLMTLRHIAMLRRHFWVRPCSWRGATPSPTFPLPRLYPLQSPSLPSPRPLCVCEIPFHPSMVAPKLEATSNPIPSPHRSLRRGQPTLSVSSRRSQVRSRLSARVVPRTWQPLSLPMSPGPTHTRCDLILKDPTPQP